MDNTVFLQDLKFGHGDGLLNFYMYNYQLKDSYVDPKSLGTVLV